MLSLICGEEARKWDEAKPDRTEFVWRKEARLLAMYIPKVETHMFSQRFLEANAVLRLRQMGVPRERPDQSHRLLFHKGQTVRILSSWTAEGMYIHTYTRIT